MSEDLVRLCLEVVGRSEPIRGWLADGKGDRRGFQGWMELAAVLEALMDATEPNRVAQGVMSRVWTICPETSGVESRGAP